MTVMDGALDTADDKVLAVEAEWTPIFDDLGRLAAETWARSKGEAGAQLDPRMVSVQLFKRLYDHRNAFALLFNEHLTTDAEIICRSAIEAAICLVNLNARRGGFVDDLKSDAASTVRGQLPVWAGDDPAFAEDARSGLDGLFGARREDGTKHVAFMWKSLAEQAGKPELYRWYKHLSGTTVHVTGISIFMDTMFIDKSDGNAELKKLRQLRRLQSLSMICGATEIGCRSHANTVGYADIEDQAGAIMLRMNAAGPLLAAWE